MGGMGPGQSRVWIFKELLDRYAARRLGETVALALFDNLALPRFSDSVKAGKFSALVGIVFYLCLNSSYTVAVFTDPGSPVATRNQHAYSHLPTIEPPAYNALTVSSTGGTRYCKKCQSPKPDRAHHCSTCKRCVLKMDHHCPWLATCVGFYNYKAFVLFLGYTCLFCYVCFAVSATWVWTEMLTDTRYMEHGFPINVILLAIISGVIGLVLTGFTAWHVSLACRGLTTIECLEKTRYLSPLRKTLDNQRQHLVSYDGRQDSRLGNTLHSYGQQLLDMHANAIPGVTREEEGEERPSPTISTRRPNPPYAAEIYNPNEHTNDYLSPAQQSLYRSYEELERHRERDRYEEYLDEQDSEKLPNAFDLGWQRNLAHLFGTNPLLWLLPICTTTGDGWYWEASSKWQEAKHDIEQQRLTRWEESQLAGARYTGRQNCSQGHYPDYRNHNGEGLYDRSGETLQSPAGVSMRTLPPRSSRQQTCGYESDSDTALDGYSISYDERLGVRSLSSGAQAATS
ncbi:palmitoyltransferase for Vac8p [Ophidiomyces ophidiicola]|nr:palmitoyltransferase for Vac8p [Ophidiomyces ophidiicola]KAI1922151.1 palmitoyltransferase for Vac8p [Ophidiomyces ophidiicola]KAI1952104.1 palmitoyltransferase for Vac8p [Ophidiomyces ophidiicola]KAI2027448.1 palmitoyltransferase for Vac8p [Ophidiomyces ophidiicola]KAI2145652.1 palmitoyltransferase for Vac8p [Ophidiomyces ophidiicola]